MDLITVLRALWRGRLFVVLGFVVACLAGVVVSFHVRSVAPPKLESRQYEVALGTVNVLVDTPDSQVIDLSPTGADAVGTRASLLASLISTSPIKNAIAQRTGIPADQMTVLGPQAGATPADSSGTKAAVANGRNANVIEIRTDETLPVISIDTQAPTEQGAILLANGAAAGLQDYLATVVKTQRVPESRRLVLRQLGTPQVGVSKRGPRVAYGVLLAVFLFTLFCGVIVLLPGVIRGLRAAAAEERAQKERENLRKRHQEAVEFAAATSGSPAYAEPRPRTDEERAAEERDGVAAAVLPEPVWARNVAGATAGEQSSR